MCSEIVAWFDKWPVSAWAALGGLGGVIVGAVLTSVLASRREQRKRQLEFLDKQLSEFYSPMLGLRSEISAHSALRVRLQSEAGAAWQALSAAAAPSSEAQRLTADRFPQFQALIECDNNKLREKLMPAYRKMLDVFRNGLWLAEADTRKHYPALVEFVDIWERWLDGSLPDEVVGRIGHTEENLSQFYDDLQTQHDRLRKLVANG
jgi:hypothetical protein